jgi:hypothetical protein
MDSRLGLFFLGFMAVTGALQAGVVVALLLKLNRLTARLDQAERDAGPHLRRLCDAIENVAALTDRAARQWPNVEATVAETVGALRKTTNLALTLAVKPFPPVALALSLWRAVRRGADVYRALGAGRAAR